MSEITERIIAIAKMFGKGRIQIPKEVRKTLQLNDGDSIYFIENLDGCVTIKKAPKLQKGQMGRYIVTEKGGAFRA